MHALSVLDVRAAVCETVPRLGRRCRAISTAPVRT
jgi:hypothetical protein